MTAHGLALEDPSETIRILQEELAETNREVVALALELERRLDRLNLLHTISRAIGARQDLRGIFHTVIRALEDSLAIDFGCVGLYEAGERTLRIECLESRRSGLTGAIGLAEGAEIAIDQAGLFAASEGELLYESDLLHPRVDLHRRLASVGLRSLVAAPLAAEGRVLGVLVAARNEPASFGRGEREFIRQLSEHVALAAHQAQLRGALQRAYDDLRQTREAMLQQERLRALGQMASGVAHDINNAISPISLYVDSLLEHEPNLSERARSYLTTIGRAIQDVAHTVSRLREFYRPREAQTSLAPVNLNEIAAQVTELTRARWQDQPQEHGAVVEMHLELDAELPPIMGAVSEIRDALINLVFNAVDAMPDGGRLTVRSGVVPQRTGHDAEARLVYLDVIDTGVGMDEETRRRCLEPFFTTKGVRGTGMGLAMVYGMLQRHAGELSIRSAPGAGTTVRLGFPTVSSTSATGYASAPISAPAPRRILLIDDDPLVLESLRQALESDGHHVTAVAGGQAGIESFAAALATTDPFTAVITDLGMPYVDGRQVAAAVKQSSAATAVVLLTGWGQELRGAGEPPPHVDRVLSKPPRLHELRAALAQLLPGSRATS